MLLQASVWLHSAVVMFIDYGTMQRLEFALSLCYSSYGT